MQVISFSLEQKGDPAIPCSNPAKWCQFIQRSLFLRRGSMCGSNRPSSRPTPSTYALARTERKNGKGYTGFVTWSAPDVTLEQDLQRRDLTINAIAQDENGRFHPAQSH